MQKKEKLIFLVILLLGIIVRIYKLYEIPSGIHIDEAGMFIDASMLERYGVDRWGNSFPVYLQNFGGGQSAMYAYITAILIKIFSCSYLLIRIPALIFGILVIILSYFITKELTNQKQALFVMAMASFCPYFIQSSRIGLDCNLLLGMSLISVYTYIKALKNKKNYLFIITGILFGLCFYTYAIGYIYIIIFLMISIIYLYKNKKLTKTNIVYLLIPFLITIIPIILFLLVNYGLINEFKIFNISFNKLEIFRANEISISNILENVIDINYKLFYDSIEYNALGYFGTIYYIFIPIFIYGIIKIIKNKNKNKYENLVLIMFISNIITLLFISDININKANSIYFSIIYITVYGIFNTKIKNFTKISLILLFINFSIFSTYYLFCYNHNDEAYFDNEIYKIINNNYEKFENKEIIIYSKNSEPQIYEKLGKINKINKKEEIIKNKQNYIINEDKVLIVDKKRPNDYKNYFNNKLNYEKYYMLYN